MYLILKFSTVKRLFFNNGVYSCVLDHVGSALLPLLVFTAVPSVPVPSALSDDLSDSPRLMRMPSLMEDDAVERSDSFYRPAMTPQEKEAFYHPVVRPSTREGKKSYKVDSWEQSILLFFRGL